MSPLVVSWYDYKIQAVISAPEFDSVTLELQSRCLARKFIAYMDKDRFWRMWDATQSHDREVVLELALSVEQHEDMQRLFTGVVKSDAVKSVLQAKNGQEALNILRTSRFFSNEFITQATAFVGARNDWLTALKAQMTRENDSRYRAHVDFLLAAARLAE